MKTTIVDIIEKDTYTLRKKENEEEYLLRIQPLTDEYD